MKTSTQPAGRILSASLIFSLWMPFLTFGQRRTSVDSDQSRVIGSLGDLGLSMGEFGAMVARNSLAKPNLTGNEFRDGLGLITKRYKTNVEYSRGTANMLDATFEVAITGVDVTTAGTWLLATSTARWAKKQGISAMVSKMEGDARDILAANIDKFTGANGLDYESIRKKKIDDILRDNDLDKVAALKDIRQSLSDHPKAQEFFLSATLDAMLRYSKSELEELSSQAKSIQNLKEDATKLSRAFVNYQKDTNESLLELGKQIGNTQITVSAATDAISSLETRLTANEEQLRVVSDITFKNASSKDKLRLLNGGYLKGLREADLQDLRKTVEAQADKEELLNKISGTVSKFNKIGQIARDLSIPLPDEVYKAIEFSNAAVGVATNFVQGDYLGAIAGITGLFGGSKPDAGAERHSEMMNYLKGNFDQLNSRLDEIYNGLRLIDARLRGIEAKVDFLIDGQAKLFAAIADLQSFIKEQFDATHEGLSVLNFKIDQVHTIARLLLYAPERGCGSTETRIRQTSLGNADSTQTNRIINLDASLKEEIAGCSKYLSSLFDQAFTAPDRGNSPLAIQYSAIAGRDTSFDIPGEDRNKYVKEPAIKRFLESYDFLARFVLERVEEGRLSKSAELGNFAMPARNIAGLQRKLKLFADADSSCVADTRLNNSLVGVLCSSSDVYATRLNLSRKSTAELERNANKRAGNILASPIMQDEMVRLGNWALFYAPLYDIHEVLIADGQLPEKKLSNLLSSPNYDPKIRGRYLIERALGAATVVIAQMNMIYGDLTAHFVFEQLWSERDKRFLKKDELKTKAQTDAAKVFGSSPNLQSNVLLLALDRTVKYKAKSAYQGALEWMQVASVNPDRQLKEIFGSGFEFDRTEKEGGRIPAVVILDSKIPLPDSDRFINREFSYPEALRQVLLVRDRLAARLAAYDVFKVSDTGDRTLMIQTLVTLGQ